MQHGRARRRRQDAQPADRLQVRLHRDRLAGLDADLLLELLVAVEPHDDRVLAVPTASSPRGTLPTAAPSMNTCASGTIETTLSVP